MPLPPQVPAPGQVFLDHIGWFVADIARAAAAFERLGFPLTPYTEHRNATADGGSVPSGTANRCAMLARGYLEILTAVKGTDTALARQLRAGLDRHEGVHLIAFTTAEPEAERARLAAAGFRPDAPVALRRPLVLDDGDPATVAFTVLRTSPEMMPEGRIQFLRQDTPDLVWQPSLIARDNGVAVLTGILLVVDDVVATADRFARFVGRRGEAIGGQGRVIRLDRGRVAFIGPEWAKVVLGTTARSSPWMAAIGLESSDLAATRALFAARGVPLVADAPDHLVVAPVAAMGAFLVVHAPGAAYRLHDRVQDPSRL
ncbi:MAG: VOC family protein [Alphaproteobacteria bacterium]|nr:VOC family protein [Alphaproteobacteria bacterium]